MSEPGVLLNVLILKILLTAALMGTATWVGRRWGPTAAGWLLGFPLTAGPVSLFLAIEQGPEFAARAAVGTVLGLASATAFNATYCTVAGRRGWLPSATLACAAFLGATLLLERISLPVLEAFAFTCLVLGLALALIPNRRLTGPAPVPPAWDIPIRIGCATGVVATLTGVASWMGPTRSGLLAPFPALGLILAAFAHRSHSPEAGSQVLRGLMIGSFAFATFFVIVDLLIVRHGLALTYVTAGAAASVVNGLSLRAARALR